MCICIDTILLHIISNLFNARGEIHRFMLDGAQRVIEYLIHHIQTVVFEALLLCFFLKFFDKTAIFVQLIQSRGELMV